MIQLPTSVIAEVDTLHSCFCGMDCIFNSLYALQNDGPGSCPFFPYPCEILPVKGRRMCSTQNGSRVGGVWVASPGSVDAGFVVQLSFVSIILLSLPNHGGVDSDDQRLGTQPPRICDKLSGILLDYRNVELEEKCATLALRQQARRNVSVSY